MRAAAAYLWNLTAGSLILRPARGAARATLAALGQCLTCQLLSIELSTED